MAAKTDPIVLAAQARTVIAKLHKQDDVVVRFKTNESGYSEDALDEQDEANPGHFRASENVLTLNLDTLLKGKAWPEKLDSIEDFRQYPVLAGVAAHEAGHARWSNWHEIPDSIPNPDFDPFAVHTENDEGVLVNPTGPESFPVSETGGLIELAHLLEEPRIERLGVNTFTKTWRRAMQLSSGHLILEQVDAMDAADTDALDSAVRMAAIVGGRFTAGTLGTTSESRSAIRTILDSAQKIIETALPDADDPFHEVMGIINAHVFNNDHDDATAHLEAARRIQAIVHPERADDPDQGGSGDGEGEGEGEEGDGGGEGAASGAASAELAKMQQAMREAIDGMAEAMADEVKAEGEQDEEAEGGGGHGAVVYDNPQAPTMSHYEEPNQADRDLRRKASDWMQRQIEPTIAEHEQAHWLPSGGARLNTRNFIRDNIAGNVGPQRSDWDRVSETVKAAPPVKVAIMLDGSGSMSAMARPSASIAWAAANAAADLPEARTVSVVYGAAAAVTQEPGHVVARTVAVSRTNGPWENFIQAAELVEDALWLGDEQAEDEPSNVLIIIVSDLMYGHTGQQAGFLQITNDWAARGFKTLVVGANEDYVVHRYNPSNVGHKVAAEFAKTGFAFEFVEPEALFQ